ncbi:MAG TPA: 8-amino-7-oxononanoate synthase [Chthoniobacteraceae bacterium]|nr:8-amino-7-oxononanoate synthase [Chthoniobacteraceae bacterium]
MERRIAAELQELEEQSLLRRLREIEGSDGAVVRYDDRDFVNFSSNDYLGLADAPFMREAAQAAIAEYGVGAGASRLVCGTLSPHLKLEETLAAFKGTQAALTFSSGYATAVGTISALAGKGDVVIVDKLVHASLVDGARLSGATLRVFPHNQTGKLEAHLQWAHKEHPEGRVLIVTESIFSMDGDRAPLAEIVEIKDHYEATLLLDEAHAVGVLGANGRGLVERLGLQGRVEVQMGTLSKALGVSGGYVCGSREMIDYLINRARSFVYSTAPPPALAAAATAALLHLQTPEGEARRRRLWDNLKILAAGLPPGLTPERLQSAIVPVLLGSEESALCGARALFEQGLFVPAIRYPTVAKGAARLRVALSALHSPEQIVALTEALWSLVPEE